VMTTRSAQVWETGRALAKSINGVRTMRLARLGPVAAALLFCSLVRGQEPPSPATNEVRLFGGVAGDIRFSFLSHTEQSTIGPAAGVAFSRRLSNHWDVTGAYVFNGLGSETFRSGAKTTYQTHEFTGGVRLWLRSRDRVAPYLTASVGGLSNQRHARSSEGTSTTRHQNSTGGGLGLGVSFPIDSKQGVIVGADLLVSSKDGHARVSGGWYRRF
jgi:hypothetical protein